LRIYPIIFFIGIFSFLVLMETSYKPLIPEKPFKIAILFVKNQNLLTSKIPLMISCSYAAKFANLAFLEQKDACIENFKKRKKRLFLDFLWASSQRKSLFQKKDEQIRIAFTIPSRQKDLDFNRG